MPSLLHDLIPTEGSQIHAGAAGARVDAAVQHCVKICRGPGAAAGAWRREVGRGSTAAAAAAATAAAARARTGAAYSPQMAATDSRTKGRPGQHRGHLSRNLQGAAEGAGCDPCSWTAGQGASAYYLIMLLCM